MTTRPPEGGWRAFVRIAVCLPGCYNRKNHSGHFNLLPPNVLNDLGGSPKGDDVDGKRIYARRLGMVEPVFANICVHKRMHRFTLHSKRKVDVQWRLFALVHNIGKIHVFGNLK